MRRDNYPPKWLARLRERQERAEIRAYIDAGLEALAARFESAGGSNVRFASSTDQYVAAAGRTREVGMTAQHNISGEARAELHRTLDRAIDNLDGPAHVTVTHGTVSAPNERNGMMETRHTSVTTIVVSPVRVWPDRPIRSGGDEIDGDRAMAREDERQGRR